MTSTFGTKRQFPGEKKLRGKLILEVLGDTAIAETLSLSACRERAERVMSRSRP